VLTGGSWHGRTWVQGELLGVDVSHHQRPGTVGLGGVDVFHARATYGSRPDGAFRQHVNHAVKADIKLIGAYCFYRQSQSAEDQFNALRHACEGLPLNLPPTIDLEWNTEFDGPVRPEAFHAGARSLVQSVAALWGECIVYTSPGFFQLLGRPDWVAERPKWLAHYYVQELNTLGEPRLEDWIGWQYQGRPIDRTLWRCLPTC
jgi:GH25 family lysozyme M1 (1,4-beta-N-acetylmuramidase)